jgi:CheY-like chemotaxis protein
VTLTNHTSIQDIDMILVDDDEDDLQLFHAIASELKWDEHLKTFTKGDDLIDLLDHLADREFPCLIVLDLSMPLSGEAILLILKKDSRFRKIPVVIYSTSMPPEKANDLMTMGASFCREKPRTMAGLKNLLSELIEYCGYNKEIRGK